MGRSLEDVGVLVVKGRVTIDRIALEAEPKIAQNARRHTGSNAPRSLKVEARVDC